MSFQGPVVCCRSLVLRFLGSIRKIWANCFGSLSGTLAGVEGITIFKNQEGTAKRDNAINELEMGIKHVCWDDNVRHKQPTYPVCLVPFFAFAIFGGCGFTWIGKAGVANGFVAHTLGSWMSLG